MRMSRSSGWWVPFAAASPTLRAATAPSVSRTRVTTMILMNLAPPPLYIFHILLFTGLYEDPVLVAHALVGGAWPAEEA